MGEGLLTDEIKIGFKRHRLLLPPFDRNTFEGFIGQFHHELFSGGIDALNDQTALISPANIVFEFIHLNGPRGSHPPFEQVAVNRH